MGKLSIPVKFVQTDGQTMVKQYAPDLSTRGHKKKKKKKKKRGGGERVKLLWFISVTFTKNANFKLKSFTDSNSNAPKTARTCPRKGRTN